MAAVALVLLISISLFVFGFTEQFEDSSPQSAFETSERDLIVTITHTHGNPVRGDNLAVKGGVVIDKPDMISAGDQIRILPYERTLRLIYEKDDQSAILYSTDLSTVGLVLITVDGDVVEEGDALNGHHPTYKNPYVIGESVTVVVNEPGTRVEFTLEPGEEQTPTGDGTSNTGTITSIQADTDGPTAYISIDT